MTDEEFFSTGEVTKMLGVSRTYVKERAQTMGIADEIIKVGTREDWVWTKQQAELVGTVCGKRVKSPRT